MLKASCALKIIAGIFIAGVVVLCLVFLSFMILPLIALIVIGVPLYFLFRNRTGGGTSRTSGEGEMDVSRSQYDVLDDEQTLIQEDDGTDDTEENSTT